MMSPLACPHAPCRPCRETHVAPGFVPRANPHDDAVLWPDLEAALEWHYSRFGAQRVRPLGPRRVWAGSGPGLGWVWTGYGLGLGWVSVWAASGPAVWDGSGMGLGWVWDGSGMGRGSRRGRVAGGMSQLGPGAGLSPCFWRAAEASEGGGSECRGCTSGPASTCFWAALMASLHLLTFPCS